MNETVRAVPVVTAQEKQKLRAWYRESVAGRVVSTEDTRRRDEKLLKQLRRHAVSA